MASETRKTEIKRMKKKTKSGARRKKMERNKGSTPKFSIHQ
ncbi:MAG TPA: hypothetical protein VIH99_04050 [Bdellovibrionota bacterium]